MSGRYFIVTEHKDGHFGYSEKLYETESAAKIAATRRRRKAGVKSARVCYTTGQTVDIKKFI